MLVHLTRKQFTRLVLEALDSLPPRFQEALENVTVLVADWPRPEQLRTAGLGGRGDLLGLYEGIPQVERGSGYNMVLPDRITIFQRPIEAVCETVEQVTEEVRATVVHEIAHHFGWSDEELAEMGR
ncbi:MAG: metallopeptidase family protein [Chloroflexi bacterium]|nr:metallopeptidase family protein [Chloroflexota bacterium]